MLAGLGVAVSAFGVRNEPVALAALGVLAPFVLAALAAETALTLYLAIRAVLNYRRRRTPGAMQVATGFILFFVGHLSIFIFHGLDATRTPIGDVLPLAGLIVLVWLLPRPSA